MTRGRPPRREPGHRHSVSSLTLDFLAVSEVMRVRGPRYCQSIRADPNYLQTAGIMCALATDRWNGLLRMFAFKA
jgi:hypothetical protein